MLIESSNDALAGSPVVRAIADSGFVPSYYLPTDLGCACLRSTGGECAREMARLATELRGGAFRGLSFDARGRVLARALRASLAPQPVLNTWTPMDRCPDGSRAAPLADQARDSLLREDSADAVAVHTEGSGITGPRFESLMAGARMPCRA